MTAHEPRSLRLVIQQIGIQIPSYRLVVYGDEEHPRHADFDSAEALAKALCAAMPDFDLSQLTLTPLAEGHGSIVFSGEVVLSATQLVALGLRSKGGTLMARNGR